MVSKINNVGHLDNKQINDAVTVFADELKISGSVGSFDLYNLLDSYIQNMELREEINETIKNHKNRKQ